MTNQEHQRIVEIYGEDYQPLDIPAYIRQREEKLAMRDEAILEKDLDWIEQHGVYLNSEEVWQV